MAKNELSPMMTQYMQIKAQHEDSLLFFRLGDFYEMFFEDAKIASEELDITLTGRDCGLEERAPMCGVPFHSCEAYIARLVEKGYKVAICEQVENPATAKGIVKRDIVRIITPGTVIEETMLEDEKNNYLASVIFMGKEVGVCFTDVSTGESHVTTISGSNIERGIIDEFSRFNPTEILINNDLKKYKVLDQYLKENFFGLITTRTDGSLSLEVTEPILLKHFNTISVENIGLAKDSANAAAFGAAISYLYETGINGHFSVNKVNVYTRENYMRFDLTAARNLEICETMRTKSKRGSLIWVLDKTKTSMGKRLLNSWLMQPLLNITEIGLRHNAVEELIANSIVRGEAAEYMSHIKDIERILTRVVYGTANAKDLNNIAATAVYFPQLKALLENANCKMLKGIFADIDPLEDAYNLITEAIASDPASSVREGGIIREGYNAEVDELRKIIKNGAEYIKDIEERERERTGIKTLKVRYNKVFGYYIEVTNSLLDKVPEDYIRKQTLTNCERFITSELKAFEVKVLNAKEQVVQLEFELFTQVRLAIAEQLVRFQKTAEAIAKLDVLCSFANVAIENNYARPLVDASGVIRIEGGRHPVVEKVSSSPFVTNDTHLDLNDNRCAIITGPNMAGKSTYMRQVAIITLMAQIGSFVPARSAQIGIVDAIFTRVGASDDLASGKSTFMVEMSEVADIIKYATKNSLLILDEIGRGTSTYDGMSIARAVLEYVADKKKLGAKALFATHYHELTELEHEFQGVKNYNIAVKKRGDDIIFLRRIVRGGADESYGIEVAKLSGIPDAVIVRAKEILKKTLEEGIVTYKTVKDSDMQLPLEMMGATEILQELKNIDVNTLTPIEAMGILFDIANKAKSF